MRTCILWEQNLQIRTGLSMIFNHQTSAHTSSIQKIITKIKIVLLKEPQQSLEMIECTQMEYLKAA